MHYAEPTVVRNRIGLLVLDLLVDEPIGRQITHFNQSLRFPIVFATVGFVSEGLDHLHNVSRCVLVNYSDG